MPEAATGPEFDSRYDPRFQRGWVEGASDAAGPAPIGDPAPVPPEPVAPAQVELGPSALRSEAPDPVGTLGVVNSTSAPPATASEPTDHGPERHPGDAGDPAARVVRISMAIAWAIAIAAVVVGAALVWSLVSRAPAFSAPTESAELIVLGLAQYAAPSMLTTGVLGVVALTVVDGLVRARRAARRTAGGGRTP